MAREFIPRAIFIFRVEEPIPSALFYWSHRMETDIGNPGDGGSQETPTVDHDEQKGTWSTSADDILDNVILEIGDYVNVSKSMGPQSVTVDDDEGGKDVDEDSEGNKAPTEEESKKPGKTVKEDDAEGTPTIRHMRKTIDGLQKRIKELETSKTKETPDQVEEGEPSPLTDEQILAIMREHEGDPEVMLNVMKYVQKQGAKSAEEAAEKSAMVGTIQKESDKYLSEVFNGYGSEELQEQFDQTIPLHEWGLDNHPLAKQIQAGLALASTFKAVVNKKVDEALKAGKPSPSKQQIEEKRREFVAQRGGVTRSTSTDTTKTILSPEIMKRAKEIGLKSPGALNLYASFLGKGKKG